jgi:hypothetical protein
MLPVALYGCETHPVTLKKETLNVLENNVLRAITGPNIEELTGG